MVYSLGGNEYKHIHHKWCFTRSVVTFVIDCTVH